MTDNFEIATAAVKTVTNSVILCLTQAENKINCRVGIAHLT